MSEFYLELLAAWGDHPLDESEVKNILWKVATINFMLQKLPAVIGDDHYLSIVKNDDGWSAGYFKEEGDPVPYGEENDSGEYIEYWTRKPSLKDALVYLDTCFCR